MGLYGIYPLVMTNIAISCSIVLEKIHKLDQRPSVPEISTPPAPPLIEVRGLPWAEIFHRSSGISQQKADQTATDGGIINPLCGNVLCSCHIGRICEPKRNGSVVVSV